MQYNDGRTIERVLHTGGAADAGCGKDRRGCVSAPPWLLKMLGIHRGSVCIDGGPSPKRGRRSQRLNRGGHPKHFVHCRSRCAHLPAAQTYLEQLGVIEITNHATWSQVPHGPKYQGRLSTRYFAGVLPARVPS